VKGNRGKALLNPRYGEAVHEAREEALSALHFGSGELGSNQSLRMFLYGPQVGLKSPKPFSTFEPDRKTLACSLSAVAEII